MKILISGAGIAGPTLAYWLAHYGLTPTLVEKSPQLRTGGYIIDFWGAGFDIADRMGRLPEISQKGYSVEEVRVVDGTGKRTSGFPVKAFTAAAGGRYLSLPRGDLAAAIYGKIAGRVETLFGENLTGMEQSAKGVRADFESGLSREFDLVIGADGLHSQVRELAFGPQNRFEKYLGYKVAAFESEGYGPRDELVYMMYTEVGQQVARFTLRGNRTLFLFIFAEEGKGEEGNDLGAQRALLHRRFGKSGWECPQILEALDGCGSLYFDRVSQIRMDPREGLWSRGRVSLIGDAASCPSLLAGQGSALAMIAAYILAGELYRSGGDHASAFSRYQKLFGPFVAAKQEAAIGFAGAFAPKSRAQLFFRNQAMKCLALPGVGKWIAGRGLLDKIQLPDYEARI